MKTKARFFRFTGAFLLLASFALAFVWFIWLAPAKHLYSRAWCYQHSTQCYWEEAQKSISRTGVGHDSSIAIADYGDKIWAGWVIQKYCSPNPDGEMHSCGEWPFHLPDALSYMTNQGQTNDTAVWHGWWEANKDKTQLEWIREGFSQQGIHLHQPLETNEIIALLKLSSSSPKPYIRYNARRWLRDSGFRAWVLDLKGISDEDRSQIIPALIKYAEWFGMHWNDPGKLPITEHQEYLSEPMLKARFGWPLYCVMAVLAIGGVWLVRYHPPR